MESNPFSSSPDPLGMSKENLFNTSPTKTRQASLSPRKPLGTATGNVQVQDFFVSTPPSKSRSAASRRDTKQQKNESESPWRIRLTLQADRMDGLEAQMSPLRLTEKRTTTTIPLKGGDDEDEVEKPVKRGRGRPRKSIDSPMPRNGTPKPKAADRRKTMLVEEMLEVGDCWAPTPPRKKRGRKKQSRQPDEERTPGTNQKLVAVAITPKTRTPERTVKARPFSRSRSRSRRKEITPKKLAEESELENDSIAAHPPKIDGSSLRARTIEKPLMPENTPSEQTSLDNVESSVGKGSPTLERSTLDVADENMWRSMLRKDNVSPASKAIDPRESLSADPTESHEEFDTILESEGFSMVSVESLQSAGSLSNRSEHDEKSFEEGASQESGDAQCSELNDIKNSTAPSPPTSTEPSVVRDSPVSVQTPQGLKVTPSLPSKPHPSTTISTRTIDEPMDGTPRIERVKRAGSALQDVPSPQQQAAYSGQTKLASPFHVNQDAGLYPEFPPKARKSSTPTRGVMNDPFSGFSAATRRELRAGLRLGEELAKRERNSSPIDEIASHRHLQQADSTPKNLEKPCLEHSPLRTMNAAPEGQVFRNSIGSNRQLPSPRSSEFDRDEDRMSWKAQTPNHLAEATPKAKTDTFSDDDWKIEYQQEKNAVVRQIQQANASQVIVINSDDEALDSSECSSVGIGGEVRPGFKDPKPLEVLGKLETSKPHRSQLPSPWRRAGSQLESSESDLFWQPDQGQSEVAKKREQRRKQRELSQSSSLMSASPSVVEQKPLHTTAHPIPKLIDHTSRTTKIPLRDPASPQTPRQTLQPSNEADPSTIDSVRHSEEEVSVESLQASEEEDSYPEEESGEWTRDCIQPTDELLQTQTSISLALDESAASVPLPGTPSFGPIDPALEGEVEDLAAELANLSPRYAQPPEIIKAPSSWFSTLTAPITSLFGSKAPHASHFPFPPISRSDILMSSPKESLPLLLPWTQAHSNALDPLYNASIIYHPGLFPYNPRSPCADLLGATIHVPNGWARKITETDCGVIDAFLVVLEARGYLEDSPSAPVRENLISCQDIAVQLVWLWVYMVTSGEVKVKDWQGVKVGRRAAGERTWTERDVDWGCSRTKYFQKKRAQFEVHGLPSWWEKGLKGPFKF